MTGEGGGPSSSLLISVGTSSHQEVSQEPPTNAETKGVTGNILLGFFKAFSANGFKWGRPSLLRMPLALGVWAGQGTRAVWLGGKRAV